MVEDDTDIARLVAHQLESAGYSPRVFFSSGNVISEAKRQCPSLFVLDIMLPGGDGLELCREIRRNSSLAGIPVIFLTAKTTEADRIIGLDTGADDYLTKPFSPRELLARVRAVLRRVDQPAAETSLEVGALRIDRMAMSVSIGGMPVAITATEFRLLDYLARHPGRVFTRDQLLDAVWGETAFVTPRSVDVYVRRLREKIESDPENPGLLKTMRGAGYRFDLPKP